MEIPYYNYIVLTRRAFFIVAALLFIIIFALSIWNSGDWVAPTRSLIGAEKNLNINVKNARYAGLDAGKLPFTISADQVTQNKIETNGNINQLPPLTLVEPKADVLLADGKWLYMKSKQAVIEGEKSRISLNENVYIYFSEGYELQTAEARMNTRLGIIVGDKEVHAQGIEANLNSQGFRLHNSGRDITFVGPARLNANANELNIDIQADGALAWHRKEQKYTAEKNVSVTDGAQTLNAQKLDVFYESDDAKKQNIILIKAQGGVEFSTADNSTISADSAIYDVRREVVLFGGDMLRMNSEGVRLRADKSIEYHNKKKLAIATGNATIDKGGQILQADVISADIRLVDGQKQISHATAEKNVFINTGEVTIRGQNGHYNFVNGQGRICGELVITQKDGELRGDCASIDMRTGVSRLQAATDNDSADSATPTRVEGVLRPQPQ